MRSFFHSSPFVVLVIVLGGFLVHTAFGGGLNYGDRPGVEYVSCYDADTCTFTLPGVDPLLGWEIPVRIRGIDAPEIRGNCKIENQRALEARDVARATLDNATAITLKNVERGKYFRIVAGVEVDGLDLASILVESGLVEEWSGEGPKPSFCPNEPKSSSGGSAESNSGIQGSSN